jgi:hypothetical protein
MNGGFVMFRTYQIQIKKGHKLYDYFTNISLLTNNLFNTTNYYRQIISGYNNSFSQPNQQEIFTTVNDYLKLKDKELFNKEEISYLNYNLLGGIFRTSQLPTTLKG